MTVTQAEREKIEEGEKERYLPSNYVTFIKRSQKEVKNTRKTLVYGIEQLRVISEITEEPSLVSCILGRAAIKTGWRNKHQGNI